MIKFDVRLRTFVLACGLDWENFAAWVSIESVLMLDTGCRDGRAYCWLGSPLKNGFACMYPYDLE